MSRKPTYEELERRVRELEGTPSAGNPEAPIKPSIEFDELFQNSFVGILRTRVEDGKTLDANNGAAHIFGYTDREEMIKEFYSAKAYVNIEDRNFMINALKRSGEVKNFVVHAKRKNGSKIWVKYSVKLYADKNYIDTVSIDITNEKEAELEKENIYKRLLETQKEELKDTQSQYRDIFHNSLVGLSRTRVSDGKLIEANNRLASMFGYKDREQMLREFYATSAYANQEDRQYMIDTIKRDGEIRDYEVFARRKDGTNLWVKYSAKVYPEKGFLDVVVIDITKEKEAEKEKERLYAQLIQSQKMEAVGRLAGGIAHDFKNMLATIKTMTQLALKSTGKNDPAFKPLTLTLNATEIATNIAQQLLIFGRRQPMHLSPIDLNATLDNLLKILSSIIPENIKLDVSFTNKQKAILGDKAKIEQAMMNLVINACDAMSDGGSLAIKIADAKEREVREVTRSSGAGNFLLLTIEDTGAGMTREVLEKIYEPFFSSKTGHGIGLGMAIVYSVVKEHGGEIRITSAPKKGTCVNIYLPVTSKAPEIDTTSATTSQSGGGERIMVVEDDNLLREAVGMLLTESGYVVFSTKNAEEALKILRGGSTNFHLILSDVVLTGMSGLQLVEELKKDKIDIPVILSSGYADQKLKWSDIEEKHLHFIEKPYDINRLLQMIRTAATSSKKSEK